MQRKTKHGMIFMAPDPVERRFNQHFLEIKAEDPSARLVKDGKGSYQVASTTLSPELKRKIEQGE